MSLTQVIVWVAATIYFAITGTLEAQKTVIRKSAHKVANWRNQNADYDSPYPYDPILSRWEIFKIVWPLYLPVFIMFWTIIFLHLEN